LAAKPAKITPPYQVQHKYCHSERSEESNDFTLQQ